MPNVIHPGHLVCASDILAIYPVLVSLGIGGFFLFIIFTLWIVSR